MGVSTQYIVKTAEGNLTVYVQNAEAGGAAIAPDSGVELSFSPESAFVVDDTSPEEEEKE